MLGTPLTNGNDHETDLELSGEFLRLVHTFTYV